MTKIVDWDDYIGRRIRLRDLRVFFMVVQTGSFARAAAHLRVSQPAVSQVIADLERSIGARLFDRSSRGVEPTNFGHVLLARGRAAFDELREGIRDIESLGDPAAGEVRIGSTGPIADTWLSRVIQRFAQQYPRVVLRIDEVPRPALDLSGLHDRKYDLVLGRLMGPLADKRLLSGLKVEKLFDDQLVVAMGIRNRWARRRKIDLAELIAEPWILTGPDSWNDTLLTKAFRESGLDLPKARVVTLSVSLRTYLLANGDFISAFPLSTVRLNADARSLKILPIELPIEPWPVVVLTLKRHALSPIVQRFISCLHDFTQFLAERKK